MKFLDLEIQNFLSIESTKTHLNDRGLILVQGDNKDSDAFGSNGAGKSSIFSESIVWALFGETIRGYKGDDVINRVKGKDAFVHLCIQDDSGDVYKIERYRKHKEHKNSVRLLKNGDNITGKSDTETTKMIEDLLQIDFLSFTNSVLFGQGMSKKFANSTDSEQKKILERILQIDIFKKCQDIAKAKATELTASMNKATQEISMNTSQIQSQKTHLSDLQDKEAQLGEVVKVRIEDLKSKKESYEKELAELPSTDSLKEDRKVLEDLKTKLLEQGVFFEEKANEKITISSELKSAIRELDKLDAEIKYDGNRLQKIIDGKEVPEVCSACGQKIPPKDMSHVIKHLQEDILAKDKQACLVEDSIKSLKEKLEKVNEDLEGKKKLDAQREELNAAIISVNNEISASDNKATSLDIMILSTQDQIEQEQKSLQKTYTDLIEKAIDSIVLLEEESKTLVEKKDSIQADIDLNAFWVDGFGNKGIKSMLLDDVVPFLNERANHYLGKLTDNSIEVEFNTQHKLKTGEFRDKFSVNVNNVNGGDKYQGNSGGECRRIDVAVNMALQDLVHSRSNKKVDLIVYDEAFEALDKSGCEVVIDLLEEKAKTCGSVIVITHNSDLAELFSDTVTVSKKNGKTVISER